MTKKELRAAMRRRNLGMAAAERAEASRRIFGRAGRLEAFGAARTVGVFCSLPDEPDTAETLARWSAAKRIVVPRVEGDAMRFYDYAPGELCRGAFGIAEPSVAERPCDPAEIDFIVVPGVAFTAAGARMGRGRGYYDKYLSQPGFRGVKAGVCYAHQLVGELPVEPHDVFMDYVVTND